MYFDKTKFLLVWQEKNYKLKKNYKSYFWNWRIKIERKLIKNINKKRKKKKKRRRC